MYSALCSFCEFQVERKILLKLRVVSVKITQAAKSSNVHKLFTATTRYICETLSVVLVKPLKVAVIGSVISVHDLDTGELNTPFMGTVIKLSMMNDDSYQSLFNQNTH